MRFVGDGVGRHHGDDALHARPGEQGAGSAAEEGENQALGQELSYEAPAAGSDRGANRNFPPPVHTAREQQVGNVDAGDQKQQADSAEQDPQGILNPAGKRLAEGQHADAPLLGKIIRVFEGEVFQNGPECGRSLLARDAGLQPAHQVDETFAFDGLSRVKDVGEIDVRAAPHEPRRHDPDHGADLVVEPEFAAEHAGIAAELPLPEPVSQHRHRRRSFGGVGGQGHAAQ